MSMKLMPKTLPGPIHNLNKKCCDWGWQGLVAYGCQNVVVVIDPVTIQIVQVLDCHAGYIVKVRWGRENYKHNLASPYGLRLAVADFNGHIYIWDVVNGKVGADCFDGSKPVTEMKWVAEQEVSRDLLLSFHPPHNLILWNTENGSQLWKKSFDDNFQSFSFDPFDHMRLALLGSDYLVFVEDFSPSKSPLGSGKKFFISGPFQVSSSSSMDKISSERKLSRSFKKMSGMLVGDLKGSTEEETSNISIKAETNCLQLEFHQSRKNHIIFLCPKEVLILDLDVNQILEVISNDKASSPFFSIISSKFVDSILCLHENGSLSLRHFKSRVGGDLSQSYHNDQSPDTGYEVICQSDGLRMTKHSRVMGVTFCPVSEKSICLIMSSGKVLIWEVNSTEPSLPPQSSFSLRNLFNYSSNLKFLLVGLFTPLPQPPFTIKMCPPLTTKNYNFYQPLLAVGSNSGLINFYNLSGGQLVREVSVHSSPVRGIEWLSLKCIISFAYQSPVGGGLVKNELIVTHLDSGLLVPLRTNVHEEESPIQIVKVSYLKQYFCIIFKEKPLEVWDAKSFLLLRQIPKNISLVTALEWSPSLNIKKLKKKTSDQESADNQSTASTPTAGEATTPAEEEFMSNVKEHFVFTDSGGELYHYMVEGNSVKEKSKIPSDATMSTITGIAWKSETLVLTDNDGNMNIWDLKGRVSRTIPTGRGCIKKVKIAPGRGNMKLILLFSDGCEVWDVKDLQRVSVIKCPKDLPTVNCVDWSASDRPVMACADGTLRVSDLDLNVSTSTMEDNQLQDPIFLPHSLPPKLGFVLKTLIQHQTWRKKYQLDSEQFEMESLPQAVSEMLDVIDEKFKSILLKSRCSVAERCLLTSQLFGDEADMTFWFIAQFYLQFFSKQQDFNSKIGKLESCFDILCDNETFKKRELDKIKMHESKKSGVEQVKRCADTLVLLGDTDRAVQLLLETEPSSSSYYSDMLKACLVASVRSSGASQSTIKLVATNLIANGQLQEGVQLLCLIDKSVDACRYMQTYNNWSQAAWLAKVSLDVNECQDVMKRWADHLSSVQIDQKDKAILVLLSLGQFQKVLELMYSQRYFERAALFIEACQQKGIGLNFPHIKPLIESIFLEYSRILSNLGLYSACLYYCKKAGTEGLQFENEVLSSKEKLLNIIE